MKCNCKLQEKIFKQIMELFEEHNHVFTPIEAIDLLIKTAFSVAEAFAPSKENAHEVIEEIVQAYLYDDEES